MDRYSDYTRNLQEIKHVASFSSHNTILPLREFPLKCDPRRSKSYQTALAIERSRNDRPLLEIATSSYKLRRVVVPPTRLQYAEPSKIPNARDPRLMTACQKINATSKSRKYNLTWEPTLVENDEVLQEEETCAVLVIDVSQWESTATKECYIEMIPHECNVQRAVEEAERQLMAMEEQEATATDEMLMTAEEAEKHMQQAAAVASTSSSDGASPRTLHDNSGVMECDSDGELLTQEQAATKYDTIEDRPMLELSDEPVALSAVAAASRPCCTDEDEDEDRVIVEPDEERPMQPVPALDDTNVELVDLDDDVPVAVKKEEPQVMPTPRLDDADVVCIDLEAETGASVREEEQQKAPAPKANDANIVCIDIEDDDEEAVHNEESQIQHVPTAPEPDGSAGMCVDFEAEEESALSQSKTQEASQVFLSKNVKGGVLGALTLDDSDDSEWDLMLDAMRLSKKESETNQWNPDDTPTTCSTYVTTLPPVARKSLSFGTGKKDSCESVGLVNVESSGRNTANDCVRQEQQQTTLIEVGRQFIVQQNRDCDRDLAIRINIPEAVISALRSLNMLGDGKALLQQTVDLSAAMPPETSDIADPAGGRSNDSDNVPTGMQRETLADVHELAALDNVNIVHSETNEMHVDNEKEGEETAQLGDAPAALNTTPKRKRRRSRKRKRFDIADANNDDRECAGVIGAIAENERRRESPNVARIINEGNASNNCDALVERVSSPIFKTLSKKTKKKTRSKKNPSENVLHQLLSASSCVISKPSVRNRRSALLINFSTFGIFQEYLKNYTATYSCIKFFCKSFSELSVFEFLCINQYIQSNNAFWQNRYNHWHREESNLCIEEDVTVKNSTNQLAIEPNASTSNQVESMNEVQPREHETVLGESSSATQSQQSFSIEKHMINNTENSWLVEGNNEKYDVDEINLQRRHSLPMATIPQQSLGVKRPRSESNDSHIKITFRRSQTHDNTWVTTPSSSTMPNSSIECTSVINAQNTPGQVIENKEVTNQFLFKWSGSDKVVPELDIDDFKDRPLPQKIQFDKSKLSLSLQSRVKKRSCSVVSAIVVDFYESTCKRRKFINSAKDDELYMDNFNYYDDRLSINDNTEESLEIRELTPDSCRELSRPPSENICNSNDDNNADISKSVEKQSCHSEDLPKNCHKNTVVSDKTCLMHDESNVPSVKNINYFMQDSSSDSESSFHLHIEELDDSSNTSSSHGPDIQIDHNCNLQKDFNSFDKSSSKALISNEIEVNLNEDLGKQNNSDTNKFDFKEKAGKLHKEWESLFGESNIEEAEERIALKYKCSKHQTNEMTQGQENIQLDNLMESRLQSAEEKQSSSSIEEQSCVQSSQLPTKNLTESGSINTITNNEEQQQQTFEGKDTNIDTTLEKDDHIAVLLKNTEKLARTTSENQEQAGTNTSLGVSDIQGNLLINGTKRNPIESIDMSELESTLSKHNQHSEIRDEEVNSDVSHCNIDDNVTSKQVFDDQHFLGSTVNIVNINAEHSPSEGDKMLELEHCETGEGSSENVANTNAEHSSSEGEKVLEFEHHKNGQGSPENQGVKNNNASSSLNQDQDLLEIAELGEGLEEGDFDFFTSIQASKSNSEYGDEDYDVNSDREELDNQVPMEYSKDINVQKLNERLVCNEKVDISNCKTDILEKDNQSLQIEAECARTISEDNHLRESVSKMTNVDMNEEDDIIIEYEKISGSSPAKDVKPEISSINNGLTVKISEKSDLYVSNLEIHEDRNFDSQSKVQKIVTPALSPQPSLHNKDSTVESVQSQTGSGFQTMDSSDKSEVEIPPNSNLLHPSTSDNSSHTPSAIIASSSNENNDKVLKESTSVYTKLTTESVTHSSTNVNVNFNNYKIFEKLNLTREIMAPEDIKPENSVTSENNSEQQTLSSSLENILKDSSCNESDVPEATDKTNGSSENVEALSTSSLVIEVSLPTQPQSGNNYDLLKALNVNLDNEVDIISNKTRDKNCAKHESIGGIKVKNLNDMLKKLPSTSEESRSSDQNVLSENSLPNTRGSSQQNLNCGAGFQGQSNLNLPCNMFAANNAVSNGLFIQTQPCTYIVNQPMPAGPIQPHVNMRNVLSAPVPIMNNFGQQMHFSQSGLVNQLPTQNNLQIPTPTATTSDKNIVLASSMFKGLIDSQATSSFCSKTVFNLLLPPLQNIMLPPPYTLLPQYDQRTISCNIEAYKWNLLKKLIYTLTELENINIHIIRNHISVLFHRKALTEDTWNIQQKILIIAQCVGSFKKLTTDKNFSNIIDAITNTIHPFVRDKALLRKVFGIFQELKKSGIFNHFADKQHPLTLELGMMLKEPVAMKSGQKEVLEYQIKIYQEMLKVNHSQFQSNTPQLNNQKTNQDVIQRNSPMLLQQNVVTTTSSVQ